MANGLGKPKRKRHGLALIVALAAAAWAVGFVIFAETIPETTPPATAKTDVIVVLTGGSLRLEAGLELLEQGAAKKLFVSGVHRGVDVEELLRLQKRSPDRLQCCIVLGHDAADTIGNADETAAWLKQQNVKSIRLVTAGYHMPRSMLEFRSAMPDLIILPHPVSPDHVKHEIWYRYPGTALLIAGEYTKFLLAWARHAAQSLISDFT